jgi:hypothetical protein
MIWGPKLANFKIEDQNCKMVKIGGPKLQLSFFFNIYKKSLSKHMGLERII